VATLVLIGSGKYSLDERLTAKAIAREKFNLT